MNKHNLDKISVHNKKSASTRDEKSLISLETINEIDHVRPKTLIEDLLSDAEKNEFVKTKRYSDSFVISGYEVRLSDDTLVDASKITDNLYASSAPIKDCIDLFWQMIWEKNIYAITMLTPWVENGVKKADMYFNSSVGKTNYYKNKFCVETCSDVTTKFDINDSNIKVMILKLTDLRQNENSTRRKSKFVFHVHYTGWPDMSDSDINSFCSLLKVYSKITDKNNFASLIHCSAGVGRTGTFIVACIVLTKIKKDEFINLAEIILDLRKRRIGMVQTQSQLDFLNKFIKCVMRNVINVPTNVVL